MSAFDDNNDPNRPHEDTTYRDSDGNYNWITRNGESVTAYSASNGPVGWYNPTTDTTFDGSGRVVGWGNWLPSLFEKK